MDRKSKQSDHMMQKSITNRDAISTSENNQMFIKKREEQQEIQDYNENAAKQKRQKEKQLKEDDIKEEVDRQHMEDEKEDQLQKERALTREKRLNHQNWFVKSNTQYSSKKTVDEDWLKMRNKIWDLHTKVTKESFSLLGSL